VQGLFSQPAATTSSATATTEFHDVYFDWTLRPYNYPPWFSAQYLTEGSTQSFNVDVPDVASGSQVVVTLWSVTDGAHALQLVVNGQAAGQRTWTGGNQLVKVKFALPAGALVSGENIVQLVTPNFASGVSQTALVHSIAVKYAQTLAGSNVVSVATSGKPQVYEVSVAGAVWVVDARMPDRAALVPFDAQNGKVRFLGQPGGTGSYLVVAVGSELAPLAVNAVTLKPVAAAQYLAVGPAQFSANVQPLLDAHAAAGLKTAFADQEQLFDYYGFGRYGPAAIHAAVQAAKPQYLLLLGRTTYDYRNYSGANVEPLCPTFLISTSFWAQATSDALFGDLKVAVGRLPMNDAAELSVAVSRILAHAALPDSGWRAQVVADTKDLSAGDFAAEGDGLAAALPEIAWTKNYVDAAANLADVTAAMTNAANGAADVVVYIGHGNAARLGKDTILDVNAVQAWTGNVVLLQSTCTGNWVAKDEAAYHSIAIQALTQPQGGIAASIGTSTYMQSAPAVAFMQQVLQAAETSGTTWGAALLKAQQWAAQQHNAWYADLSKTESILGDPAMKR